MKTRRVGLALSAFWLVLPLALGDERPGAAPKEDYTELSRLVKGAVLAQLPKVYANESGWGQTVPIPDKLRLMALRTVVKVGDRLELPNGTWRKTRVWMTDPPRDLDVQIRSLKKTGDSTYRLKLDAGVVVRTETELQQWARGLKLLDVLAKADADVGVSLDCDVALSVDLGTFPPGVKVAPKVTNLQIDLRDFQVREVDSRRLGKVLEGEQARALSDEYKGVLQDLVHTAEPLVKEYANRAIEQSLKEGKGTFSAGSLLKSVTPSGKVSPKDGK